MLIQLSELLTCEGKEKTYAIPLEMTGFHGPTGDYDIAGPEPVSLRITHVGNRVLLLEGKARLALLIPCDRCLEPVVTRFDLDITSSLDMKQTDQDRIKDLDQQPYVSGYDLDVDQLVCNELMLSLPMKVLCSETCKGICNRCGTNLNKEACGCSLVALDPRMSVIQDVFQQFKEV